MSDRKIVVQVRIKGDSKEFREFIRREILKQKPKEG